MKEKPTRNVLFWPPAQRSHWKPNAAITVMTKMTVCKLIATICDLSHKINITSGRLLMNQNLLDCAVQFALSLQTWRIRNIRMTQNMAAYKNCEARKMQRQRSIHVALTHKLKEISEKREKVEKSLFLEMKVWNAWNDCITYAQLKQVAFFGFKAELHEERMELMEILHLQWAPDIFCLVFHISFTLGSLGVLAQQICNFLKTAHAGNTSGSECK